MVYHTICDTDVTQQQMFEELHINKLLDSALAGYIIILMIITYFINYFFL